VAFPGEVNPAWRTRYAGQMTETLKILLESGTAVISDVFDSLALRPPVLDTSLFPVKGSGQGFAGPAYTIVGEAQEWTKGGDREKLAAIDSMTPGVVPVGPGRTSAASAASATCWQAPCRRAAAPAW
jgi:hypothetical protein